jgi:serine protease Do
MQTPEEPIMKNTAKPLGWALLGGGVALVTTAGAIDLPWFGNKDKKEPPPATPPAIVAPATPVAAAAAQAASPAPVVPAGAAPNYRAIVQQYGPAVVGISVEGSRKTGNDDADPMQRFFRNMPGWRGGMPPAEQPFRGQGSGFLVADDGLVLTNAHVVRDASEVTVRLADRREYRAKVLGADPATDIAVLRIDAKGLPAVRLGDPKSLMVGDYVLAIGAPYGLEQTATSGIVSAKGRSLPGDAFVPFIQTDAAVNPGNSGGPLFDAAGNVVGINSQIYSRTGGFQGVSFAIPIDVALKVRDQIVATGRAQHARLGVGVQDLNQSLAESFGLKRPDGALISSVDPKSPAATAGLKAGDVILQIDGEPMVQAGAVSSRIGLSRPGQKVKLKIWRDQAERDVEVTLAAAKGETRAEAEPGGDAAKGGRLGLALRPLTPEERQQANVDQGLLVQGAQGPAARAGLEQGDVVLAINGKPVNSVEDIKRVLDGKPRSVALLVWRDGDRLFVPVPLG